MNEIAVVASTPNNLEIILSKTNNVFSRAFLPLYCGEGRPEDGEGNWHA